MTVASFLCPVLFGLCNAHWLICTVSLSVVVVVVVVVATAVDLLQGV